jgi:formamidopyrimidine-DNA glycosylase
MLPRPFRPDPFRRVAGGVGAIEGSVPMSDLHARRLGLADKSVCPHYRRSTYARNLEQQGIGQRQTEVRADTRVRRMDLAGGRRYPTAMVDNTPGDDIMGRRCIGGEHMPELPEIRHLATQIAAEMTGKKTVASEVRQEKCLNVPVAEFERLVIGRTIGPASSRGKWIFVPLADDALFLLNLGMGGDCVLHEAGDASPDKYQVRMGFDDGTFLTIAFWWFGYAHVVPVSRLAEHAMTASLGLDPLAADEFSYDAFATLVHKKKCRVKTLLTDQKFICGIGNVYVQDILFRAGLHPDRKTSQIADDECRLLHRVIVENLRHALDLGGLEYERDLHGRPGRFSDFLVGYRAGKPCPVCGATIQKIKTGSTASFICPQCQT